MKQIVLVRHREVDIKYDESITSSQFGKWIEKYNSSKIKIPQLIDSELKSLFDSDSLVICSELVRAKESVAIFGKEIYESNSIFNEFEMPYIKSDFLKLKPKYWLLIYRVLWFFGFSNNCESYKEAKDRVVVAVDRLVELSSEHNRVILVNSGFINRFIYSELLRRGWSGSKRISSTHLGYGILCR